MLLFIYDGEIKKLRGQHFKTSYVTVYLLRHTKPLRSSIISKHRMLLFIKILEYYPDNKANFKTSYVTVYHISQLFVLIFLLFQNIVCYCLSNDFKLFSYQLFSLFPLFYAISTFFTSQLSNLTISLILFSLPCIYYVFSFFAILRLVKYLYHKILTGRTTAIPHYFFTKYIIIH